jgi:hypothetical protein
MLMFSKGRTATDLLSMAAVEVATTGTGLDGAGERRRISAVRRIATDAATAAPIAQRRPPEADLAGSESGR